MRLQSILCAVDFSQTSREALRAAADLARAHDSRLTVLFVDDPMLVAAAKAAHDVRGSVSSTEVALNRFIARSLRPLPPEVRAMVTSGTPVDEILRAARRQQADLIVIGMRGVGRVARMLLGSTTDRVLRRARIPVLAVPTGVTS
jgi:nucleotide-binding universal stress UspA family protein